MKKKLVLNTTMSLLLQVVSVICGFILPRMILECYGTEVNGLIQSIAQFLSVISFMELGVGQVIQSSLYRPLSLGNIESVSKVLKSGDSFFKKLAYALLGYTAVICIIYPIAFDVKQGRIYTIMLIVAMSISSFTQYCFGLIDKILLSADQKGYIQYAVQIICNVLNVMVISYLIYKKCSIQSVKFASAAVFLIGPIIIRCYINKKYKIDRKIKYDEEPVKQKWNGIAQHIANVILEGTDIIILTTFSTLSNVSVYSVYFMVISGVRQLYTSITAGVQSMIGTLWAKNEIDNLKDVFLSVEIILHFIVVFLLV